MDDSLQQWCDHSLANLKKSSCRLTQSPDRVTVAERLIETAAFVKLAKAREINDHVLWESLTFNQAEPCKLMETLTSACPLGNADPPEALGLIHEYLVSRRDKIRTRQSSTSRKSSGIFYTPPHVVEYIVNRTLIPRLETMSPDQADGLAILDPAMGCGAFLLTAFRTLLAWYLNWYQTHQPEKWPDDIAATSKGWRLTLNRCHAILCNNLYGVDLDADAAQVVRRILWLVLIENSVQTSGEATSGPLWLHRMDNLKTGHALIGAAFGQPNFDAPRDRIAQRFHWADQFPEIARRGGFDLIIGNPPYRRERGYRQELDDIAKTHLGRFRSPRMDLWYYFVHRGVELLREDGSLSYITNAYWVQGAGAEKLRKTFRDDVHLDEIFLLHDQPLFQGVSGRHSIFLLTKTLSEAPVAIKVAPHYRGRKQPTFVTGATPVHTFSKPLHSVFAADRIHVSPPADDLLAKLNQCPRLSEFGMVRQGIAENPAAINRRTIERYPQAAQKWLLGEGVFSLSPGEVKRLKLSKRESKLLRPYHDLSDLGRYWSAEIPSRSLIYSTRLTCPVIEEVPNVGSHLERFRPILDSRRETAAGSNQWWHLHWPRDEKICRSQKLVALQMASRPSLVPTFQPTYVSFSANVFVPFDQTKEDLRYLSGLLNSTVLWAWFEHHAKHRGVGLEINGHVLEEAPIRRIDFDSMPEVVLHDKLVSLVTRRMQLQEAVVARESTRSALIDRKTSSSIRKIESDIDRLVARLYGLDADDIEAAHQITSDAFAAR